MFVRSAKTPHFRHASEGWHPVMLSIDQYSAFLDATYLETLWLARISDSGHDRRKTIQSKVIYFIVRFPLPLSL